MLCVGSAANALDHPTIYDAFGRDITDSGLTLIDWNGYVANPVIQYTIEFDEPVYGTLEITSDSPMVNYWPVAETCEPLSESSDASCVKLDDQTHIWTHRVQAYNDQEMCLLDWSGLGLANANAVKALACEDLGKLVLGMSWMPDRDSMNSNKTITYKWTSHDGQEQLHFSMPVNVLDLDDPSSIQSKEYVQLDWSQNTAALFDDSTPEGAEARGTVSQAAADWNFFIDNAVMLDEHTGVPQTPPDSIQTWLYDLNYSAIESSCDYNCDWRPNQNPHWNEDAFTGFKLYGVGVRNSNASSENSSCLRSTGFPSNDNAQGLNRNSSGPFFRSGMVAIEVNGNYCNTGWSISDSDSMWRFGGSCDGCSNSGSGNVQSDLYSISHHEMAHAFAFDWRYPNFAAQNCNMTPPPDHGFGSGVEEYWRMGLGSSQDSFIGSNAQSHLNVNNNTTECLAPTTSGGPGAVIDPASQRGAFGNEQHGNVPWTTRWMITKLDLHVLEDVGYAIRSIGPMQAFAGVGLSMPPAESGNPYSQPTVLAQGGMGLYDYALVSGDMPLGLSLNGFTGAVTGTPQEVGDFTFSVKVTEYPITGQSLDDVESFQIDNIELSVISPGCHADFNGNGKVEIEDLLYVLSNYGDPAHDLDNDGDGDLDDLLLFIESWGTLCS